MQEATAFQSTEQLQALLDYLVCPLDGSSPLTAVRDSEGSIVALESADHSYPVVNNIPHMIPEFPPGLGRDLLLWREHQVDMWQNYQDGDEGVFTTEEDDIAGFIGEILRETGAGLFLDIGCGALAQPAYMLRTGDAISWIGVDPFLGQLPRHFPFAQAVGEYLPFRQQTFDGVLYAATFLHQIDPLRSLQRVRAVLRPGGSVYVWHTALRPKPRYILWKATQILGWRRHYSRSYRWAFTDGALYGLLRKAGFFPVQALWLCGECSQYDTCSNRNEYLVIGRRT